MFWKKKWITRSAFGFQVDVTVGSDSEWIMRMFEKASALQDQNRRDYNLLFERQNLILNHLNLEYIPETEKTEPAKLMDKKEKFLKKTVDIDFVSGGGFSEVRWKDEDFEEVEIKPKKKRKYTKRKK